MPNESEKNQEKCLTQAEVSQLLQERIAQERRRSCPSCAISAPTQASAKRRNQPCRTNLKKTRKNA